MLQGINSDGTQISRELTAEASVKRLGKLTEVGTRRNRHIFFSKTFSSLDWPILPFKGYYYDVCRQRHLLVRYTSAAGCSFCSTYVQY